MKTPTIAAVLLGVFLHSLPVAQAAEPEPAPSIAEASTEVSADVEFPAFANWEVGDEYRIEYFRERTNLRNGVLKAGKAWAIITARVEEKTPDGYVIAWTNDDAGLDNYAQGAGAKVKEIEAFMADISKNLRIEIQTADTGFPTGLRNRDEMVSHMKVATQKILTTLDSDPKMQAKIQSALQQVLNPQMVETQALTDAYFVYGLMGGSYRGGQVDTYDIELPFPFGGPPIPATLHVLLREFDEQTGLARITSQSIPNPVQLKNAMVEWMIGIAKSQGKPGPKPSQVPELFVQDTIDYIYDRKTQLPREVISEKYIRVAGGASIRIDRRTYHILPKK